MDFLSLQVEIVKKIAGTLASTQWRACLFDCEILEVEDGYDFEHSGVVLLDKGDGNLSQDQFYIDAEVKDLCIELYSLSSEGANKKISGFTLKIDNSGKYRYEFKYELRRMKGIWDDAAEDYIDNYLKYYLEEIRSKS